MLKHINQISEQAFLLDFGSEVDIHINKYVIAFANCILEEIKKNSDLGIKNCVPSYNKILIQFDFLLNKKIKIIDFLHSISKKNISPINIKKVIEIPICYNDKYALDIIDVSKQTQLSKKEIIKFHLKTQFYVYMIGFMPGLPFMGNLDKKLSVPRKLSPRVNVPSGSVGIVDNFCVINSNNSPGGWNIIGRTPQKLFYKNRSNPSFFNPGHYVKFKLITRKKFEEIKEFDE